jgi:hypothetical protein
MSFPLRWRWHAQPDGLSRVEVRKEGVCVLESDFTFQHFQNAPLNLIQIMCGVLKSDFTFQHFQNSPLILIQIMCGANHDSGEVVNMLLSRVFRN